MNSILQIKNLTTIFSTEEGKVIAADNVSFHLGKGETLGIVGESGSGKSVTSLSIMRLIASPPGKVESGEIIYSGQPGQDTDLLKLPIKQMRRYRGNEIAMIFQEPMTSLNPVFTCGNQVAEAIKLHQRVSSKEAKHRTIELFKEVQLPRPEKIYDSYPHQVSGGQKQRVMIAMAISCNPQVLIADEPTTALDVTVQKTILELIARLKEQHQMSVMFITHDLGVIAEIADRVLVMYKGSIVEQGTTEKIFNNPQHPYTKGLLACRPPLDRRLSRLPTMLDFMDGSSKSANEAFAQGEVRHSEEPGAERTEVKTVKSVEQLHKELEVTAEERSQRHGRIYDQKPVLKVQGLKTWFPIRKGIFSRVSGYVKAVDDVSFDVYPGETLGLVGESGCGKTTLGRTILRLIEPTAGQIEFEGRDLMALTDGEMRRIRKHLQIIFQDPYSSLNPRLTIGSAIIEPMQVHKLHGTDRQRRGKVMDLLHRVGLEPRHYNRYPHEFSGGQRQRICIARALAVEPNFIICDESVSALDVSVQAQVLNLLNELQREFGLTYIFISHDLSVVKFMSDRMIVMNQGKIEEMGKAEEIYYRPQQDYTKKLIAAIPQGNVVMQ